MTVTDVQKINEVAQIGWETTAGTAVAATRRLAALKAMVKVHLESKQYKAAGSRWVNASQITREWSEITVDESPATYDELAVAFAMLLGQPVISTPGGGTLSRDQQWSPSSTAPLAPATVTLESGSPTYAKRAAGAQLSSLSMDWGNDGVTVGGAGFGRLLETGVQLTKNATYTLTAAASPPTAGTYTLTVTGITTAAIAFGATPATVQAALELLSTVGTGNVVVTLLAAGPTTSVANTTYTIEFRGLLAGTAITMTGTFTGLTPSNSITVPAGVVGSTPAQLALLVAQPDDICIYADASAAALGTTKLLAPHGGGFSLSDLYGPYFVLDSAQTSYKNAVETDPGGELRLTHQANAVAYTFLANARLGTPTFIRVEMIGPLIEGALYNRIRLDFSAILTGFDEGEDQGVVTADMTFAIRHDPTWTRALQFNTRNTITAL